MNYLSLAIEDASGNPINIVGGGAPIGGKIKLEEILQVGIVYLYIAAIILALFFLIWGGFSWITSEGDKQRLAQARQRVVMAIIGLIIVFLAFFVINLIGTFFGINLLSAPNFGGRSGGH